MGWFSPRYKVEYWSNNRGRWSSDDDCEFRSIRRAAAFMARNVSRTFSVRHYRIAKIDTGRVLMRLSRTGWLNDHEIRGDDRWYPAEESEVTVMTFKPEAEWWD